MALTYELAGGGTIIEKSLGRMRNVQVVQREDKTQDQKGKMSHSSEKTRRGGGERGGRVSAGLEEHWTVSQNRLRF